MYLFSSFEDDAEARCKESLDKATEADVANPESFHLLASYWLSKDDRTVECFHFFGCYVHSNQYLW